MTHFRHRSLILLLVGTTLISQLELTLHGQLSFIGGQPMSSVSGGGASYHPQFSHDGQRIVFLSYANNLVTNDDRGFWLDAFVRDLDSLTTHLISVGFTGNSGATENVTSAIISPDGQSVVFASAANNLVASDPNGTNAALLRHISAALTTTLVTNLSSTAVANPQNCFQPTNRPVFAGPAFSADGRVVVFESYATNLVANDTNELSDVFVLRLANSQIDIVSAGAFAEPCPRPLRRSYAPAVNADGSRVAFVSTAILPAATVYNPLGDVYVRDLTTAITYWASREVGLLLGQSNGLASLNPTLSADGRHVAFLVSVGGAAHAFVVHHDLETGASMIVSSNTPPFSSPIVSTNGHIVTYIEGDQVYQWFRTNLVKTLISINRDGTAAAGGKSHSPAVTPDGRFVVFLSDAPDLVAGNSDRRFRLYQRDVAAGTTQLITPPDHAADEANQPVISHDGRRIAFASTEPLVAGDSNRAQDIFVFDAVTGGIQLVSRTASGLASRTESTHKRLGQNAMSSDGRFVGYESFDNDLISEDTNGLSDAFVYDQALHTRIFLGSGAPQLETRTPRLSSNGRYVAFADRLVSLDPSSSMRIRRRDLVTGDTLQIADQATPRVDYPLDISNDGNRVLYETMSRQGVVKDIRLGVTHMITNGLLKFTNMVLSPDGRWVFGGSYNATVFDLDLGLTFAVGDHQLGAFSADSRSLILHRDGLARLDLQTRTVQQLWNAASGKVLRASVSADGLVVAFEASLGVSLHTVVIDLRAGTTNNLSTMPSNSAFSSYPLTTYDGRYAAFLSMATNLVPGDTNESMDLFVHDRSSGQTISITGASGIGSLLTRRALAPVLGGDGRSILFMSLAPDLITNDFNGRRDIFVLKLGSDDEDHDGLDDDWEWAYFSTLNRDGPGDFDNDGSTDATEFRAGTDPTNEGSVFRVLTISRMGTDEVHLVWQSVPGKTYRVQYRDMAGDAGWVDTAGLVTAQSFSASKKEVGSSAGRYYRVVLSE